MAMVNEERSAAEEWLREKMKNRCCTVCQASDWAVGDLMVYHSDDLTEEIVRNNPTLLEVVCQNCAHVLFFDARRMPGGVSQKATQAALM